MAATFPWAVMLTVNLGVLGAAEGIAVEMVRPYALEHAQDWSLVWQDEFQGHGEGIGSVWKYQHGPSFHILCSRWRENILEDKGILALLNRRESRGGQAWTSGSMWTSRQFLYGYFECRYRYAGASGINNSFWLMPQGALPEHGVNFEIDVNEGHFPNEVNTNVHNHSAAVMKNGKRQHPQSPKAYSFGSRPDVRLQFETPVVAKKIRIVSHHDQHIHLDQLRILGVSSQGYPEPLAPLGARVNLAHEPGVHVAVSGNLNPAKDSSAGAVDDVQGTRWLSQREGEKWIEITLPEAHPIGCVEWVNGWRGPEGDWRNLWDDYRCEYEGPAGWTPMGSYDVRAGEFNFSKDFQVVGLEWNEHELVYYLNGKELRRLPNEFCHNPAAVWLSSAIIPWSGAVTDAIDGTKMEVDYVRVFEKKP